MTDNVISFETGKAGGFHKVEQGPDEIMETVKQHNEENLTSLVRANADGEVRALVTIALNYDGSVSWLISGQSSNFEIIAALEQTKLDFMQTE